MMNTLENVADNEFNSEHFVHIYNSIPVTNLSNRHRVTLDNVCISDQEVVQMAGKNQ